MPTTADIEIKLKETQAEVLKLQRELDANKKPLLERLKALQQPKFEAGIEQARKAILAQVDQAESRSDGVITQYISLNVYVNTCVNREASLKALQAIPEFKGVRFQIVNELLYFSAAE